MRKEGSPAEPSRPAQFPAARRKLGATTTTRQQGTPRATSNSSHDAKCGRPAQENPQLSTLQPIRREAKLSGHHHRQPDQFGKFEELRRLGPPSACPCVRSNGTPPLYGAHR